jgi:FAD/FMN-containing dehydrogenase
LLNIAKIEVNLPHVLDLDAVARLVRVEPMVTIGKLNDYLISR